MRDRESLSHPSPRSTPMSDFTSESGDDLNMMSGSQSFDADTLSTSFQNTGIQNGPNGAPHQEQRMRRRLKFFFMNPWQKWRVGQRFPWKLLLQVFKILLVTIQLCIFGSGRASGVGFLEKSGIALKHLFLYEWEPSYETLPYPPTVGTYAVYSIPKFYEHIDFTVAQYSEIQTIAIGTYDYDNPDDKAPPITMCTQHYKAGEIFAFNQSYSFDSEVINECFPLPAYNGSGPYKVEDFLKAQNRSINFDGLINTELQFKLNTVHLRELSKRTLPDCFLFQIKIRFENTEHNGQMPITLELYDTPLECKGYIKYRNAGHAGKVAKSVFDGVVILISACSMCLCIRSIYRAHKLRISASKFFLRHLNKKLSIREHLEFLDFWYIIIIINDLMTITGSVLKLLIENYDFEAKQNDWTRYCSLLLGTGIFFVWFGMLRYFGFFAKYNILLLTLKRCCPNVLRFVVVAGLFYVGFCFCGWVVLGPYHIKFRSLSATSECLFSLVNGDDMFVTFSVINDQSSYVWIYSRIYLYSFISLFIYVVLAVFISVIMDSYETIKKYHEDGFPLSDMMEFVEQSEDDGDSPLYRTDELKENDCCYACATCRFWPRWCQSCVSNDSMAKNIIT